MRNKYTNNIMKIGKGKMIINNSGREIEVTNIEVEIIREVFEVDENYIMWGFRYALGRRTGAVLDVVDILKRVWPQLTAFTQQQIKEEIEQAIKNDNAGSECDVDKWKEILKLTKKGK